MVNVMIEVKCKANLLEIVLALCTASSLSTAFERHEQPDGHNSKPQDSEELQHWNQKALRRLLCIIDRRRAGIGVVCHRKVSLGRFHRIRTSAYTGKVMNVLQNSPILSPPAIETKARRVSGDKSAERILTLPSAKAAFVKPGERPSA